ncbi:hypothetical protein [Pseudomonas gingeri]|uniref:hypothetical protein n=1 Tax=Pseudomonas gingeri TaxID=117681 RepID=UPI0015A06659|nr:hypothetical protein [Pseudomonas gingeri]NWA02262.1 hypothetical protein [Pseudomonas gingeri]NWA17869.1 hypothetical protein [Pseudomonas gingeri]NWA56782.1 hypothetical protein [Pseudomonas gingeri]NWA97085.1 hypothetical protein [Pseudomonas gingeri]NWB03714.1 hypothetical protein [Pseudomonas gingeri]
MTVSLAATTATAAAPPAGGQGGLEASQNLFEHMANSARSGMPEGASPHQIGSNLMERLNGFIDRSRTFAERADALSNGPPASSPPVAGPGPVSSGTASSGSAEPAKKVTDQHLDQVVHSLSRMFDYSIETQMVVRGATQISGAANTLLRGQ